MANIVYFKPGQKVGVRNNLAAFIKLAREQLTVFGAGLEWEAPVWPKLIGFSKLGVTTRKPQPEQLMDDNFIDFAKAYFRYQQGHKRTQTFNESKALQVIESALIQVTGSAHVFAINIAVLDEAAKLTTQHYSKGAAYHCGRELERLANFLTEYKLTTIGIQGWKSPINRKSDKNKTGAKAKEEREKKLPNEFALNALAEIFANNLENERDKFTTSVFAMLMCAPSRISEVLVLPADCEVYDVDKDGNPAYGWRFYSAKGFEGNIKWIPSTMVSVAKTAVFRAKKLSNSARDLAKWIEDNPNKFFRHANCPNVAADTPLTKEQACQALGLSVSNDGGTAALNQRKLSGANGAHTLNSLWKHVMSRLPKGFPWFDKSKGIKYSNALFALNSKQLNRNKSTSFAELQKPTVNLFNNDLSPRESLEYNHQSIFDRHGYKNEIGERLKLTSHQARHLLNTIAERGGLSQLEQAEWAGRADLKQNKVYNHMTTEELVGMAESLDVTKPVSGAVDTPKRKIPVSQQEFNMLEQGAAHVTKFGYCVLDFTQTPCQMYRDCIHCSEQVCVKGEAEKLRRLKDQLVNTERLLELAQKGLAEADFGADKWVISHQRDEKRLKEIIAILEDPSIEDGAQIKLVGNGFTQLKRVIDKKRVESSNQVEDTLIKDISVALGGGFG